MCVKKNDEHQALKNITSLRDFRSIIASFNIGDSFLQMYHKLAFISVRHK